MIGTIVTGGNLIDASLLLKYTSKADIIIGVDRGIEFLVNHKIEIDFALGDFDSISNKSLLDSKLIKKTITLNPIKDISDTHAALELAMELGVTEFFILSGIGSRMDHTLSNISLLQLLDKNGVVGFVIDNNNRIRYAKKQNEVNNDYDFVSVIPLEDGVTVTTQGFAYKTDNLILNFAQSRFVSNELKGSHGNLEIKGKALIIETRD